jgi:hypothetical protein
MSRCTGFQGCGADGGSCDVDREVLWRDLLSILGPLVGPFLGCVFSRMRDQGDSFSDAIGACLFGGGDADPPFEPPGGKEQALGARCTLRQGNAMCTGTLLSGVDADGSRLVLSASHCGSGSTFRVSIGDTVYSGRVVARSEISDLVLLQVSGEIPRAGVGVWDGELSRGESVWHAGYGRDVPGNVEEGIYAGVVNLAGDRVMSKFTMSASPGDSGSGIFSTSQNKIVSVVCCVNRFPATVTYGGSVAAIRMLLASVGYREESHTSSAFVRPLVLGQLY